jgi:transcriptional regulator of acetoin/glycerol metabolism
MAGIHDAAPLAPDARGVARDRLRFLTADPTPDDQVRPPILASWRRSRDLRVAADRIDLPYLRDPDLDTPLTRSAAPVLDRLHQQLAGQAVGIVLTDPGGLVLVRRTGDATLERHLDRVRLAVGFSYAEEFVGTNGIGTALEAGSATAVFGHEHYAENLEMLACAGVPIHDPMSGRVVGLIDLTCWRRDAEALLLTLARATADQIEGALRASSGVRELAVLQAFRRACLRTGGIVFAVTDDALTVNDHARAELEPLDQAALLAHAVEVGSTLAAGRRRSVDVLLPTGSPARMYCHQVDAERELAGLVVHVRVGPRDEPPAARHAGSERMLLPGLVGDAPLWQRACREVEAAVTSDAWVVVEGEPGVGKTALLRAVQLRRHPARRLTVLDAARAAGDRAAWTAALRAALADGATVVVIHVDTLATADLRALSATLQDVRRLPAAERPQVVLTRLPGAASGAVARLLSLFPTTVSVPPLRLRLEDLGALVPFLLAKLGPGGHVSCSAAAMRLLMRSTWPGNVGQLQQLLHRVVQQRRSGVVDARDLPPELHSTSRRVLSTLEAMERDAIVASLADAHGNKVAAARSLGMSRATMYRRIHEFGIVPPA